MNVGDFAKDCCQKKVKQNALGMCKAEIIQKITDCVNFSLM